MSRLRHAQRAGANRESVTFALPRLTLMVTRATTTPHGRNAMSHNTFGHLFRVTTFGESHGVALGCVVDGCPPRIPLTAADIQPYLDKRRPGQSRFTTQRREPDMVKILSGTFPDEIGARGHDRHADRAADRERRPAIEGLFRDQRHLPAGPRRLHLRRQVRPARLPRRRPPVRARNRGARRGRRDRPQDRARHGGARRADPDRPAQDRSCALGLGASRQNPFFCPDASIEPEFEQFLDGVRKQGSSVGAVIEVVAENIPAGLGAPVYGKLDADLAGALMSINAVKGVEIGDGFATAAMSGEENGDEMRMGNDGRPRFLSNHAGGILGGISTGQPVVARFAVKPTSSILNPRKTVDRYGNETEIVTKGRHDPCVGIRAVPIGEAMMACVIADHYLRHRGQVGDGAAWPFARSPRTMSFSGIFAQIVALIGAAALQWRKLQGVPPEAAWGSAPVVPAGKPQGAIPTLKMPTAQGWAKGRSRVAAPGLKVNAFATGLEHPRWIEVLPNGDVLLPSPRRSPDRSGACSAMRCRRRCGVPMRSAFPPTASRCCATRTATASPKRAKPFMEGLNQPFGMALLGDTFYVGNTDGVVAFPYAAGADSITAPGRKLVDLQAGRALDAQPAAEPGWKEALCRRRLAQQHRRARHGGRGRPRLPSTSSIWRAARAASLPAACATRSASHGSRDRRALDRGQRARRPRRRDAARLSDLGARWRLLRLALLLLGADGGRSRAAGPGHGRESDHAGLRARRAHRVARPLLAPGRHAAGLSRRHGHRPARLVEPQHAQRLQGGLRPVRERAAVRAGARYSVGLPRARRDGVLRTAGRRHARPRRRRFWWPTMSAT